MPDGAAEAPANDPRSQGTSQSGDKTEGGQVTNLPLSTDTVIRCKWKDGEYHLARVVSTRVPEGKSKEDTEYYMHFINMNRRMDTWCSIGMMDMSWHVLDSVDEKRCCSSYRPLCSDHHVHCWLLYVVS